MNEKEAKEMLYTLVANNCRGNDEYKGSYEQAFDIIIDLLEQKDTRIDELEKALIDEDFKYRNKINKLKNKLKEDKEKMQTYYDDNEMNYYKQIDYILKILEG